MITIVLTNRDRELRIVKNCLDSLASQSVLKFEVYLVDYGSHIDYVQKLQNFIQDYSFVKLIICSVQGQLWNKSRAINIALKQTIAPYFLVGDIDLIFHPDFILKISDIIKPDRLLYFQNGFLNKEESLQVKSYESYVVEFNSDEGATGVTLFPTEILKKVNGYDEFYHGWGAEDTDIHLRLKNLGFLAHFYNSEILVKHQWHSKIYRSNESTNPYHSKLEQINHAYMQFAIKSARTKSNIKLHWGKLQSEPEHKVLQNNAEYNFVIWPIDTILSAVLNQLRNFENNLVNIVVKEVHYTEKLKQRVKYIFGKKYKKYISLQDVNNILLEEIILNYRNHPYHYVFKREKSEIHLTIQL